MVRTICSSTMFAMLLVFAMAMSPRQAKAETPVVYMDGDRKIFEVDIPDFWSMRTGGIREIADPDTGELRDVSRVFGLRPDAHSGIWLGLMSPHGVADLAAARDYLQDIGPFLVQDTELNAPKNRQIAGYPARTVSGKGRRGSKRIEFTAVTIDLPGDRVVIAVAVFEAGADVEPVGDINAILSSIRAIR